MLSRLPTYWWRIQGDKGDTGIGLPGQPGIPGRPGTPGLPGRVINGTAVEIRVVKGDKVCQSLIFKHIIALKNYPHPL